MALPSPAHIYQLDGSSWAPYACMGAVGAMALDAYTRGAIRVGQADIRKWQGDRSGGIGLPDVQTAWRVGYKCTFWQGAPSWSTIAGRLRAGEGVAITCTYGLLGSYRAKGSTFIGAHALYLQRYVQQLPGSGATEPWIMLDDPLQRMATSVPESVVRRAWSGGAGWGLGVYTGAGDLLGAFYQNGAPLVTYPRGATTWSAAAIMGKLRAAHYFDPGGPNVGAPIADAVVARILAASEGQPWTDALIASWAAQIGNAANVAGASLDPTGGALGALGAALTDLPTTLARSGLVLGLVALALLGVALTFREPLTQAATTAAKGASLA